MSANDETLLILFSGLPGTGKTTLARRVAQALGAPLFAKDRLQSVLWVHGTADRATADGYHLLLDQADEQLALGISVVLDAVFPLPGFREQAREIAARHGARFRVVYCFCSDEAAWRARMAGRRQLVPHWAPVGWEEVERLAALYTPWAPGTALPVDACDGVDENLARVLKWIR